MHLVFCKFQFWSEKRLRKTVIETDANYTIPIALNMPPFVFYKLFDRDSFVDIKNINLVGIQNKGSSPYIVAEVKKGPNIIFVYVL